MEARSPDPATPAGPDTSASEGCRRRPRRRARRIALRAVGRKMALFAAANAVLSLFLPWMVIESRSVNAFALGSEPVWLALFDAVWVARAVWAVLGAAVLVTVLVLVDRVRPLGTFLGFVSLAAGGGMMFLAVMVFETVLPLRQLGVIACGVGGLVMVGSGAVLFRAKWRPPPAGAESILARPRELPWVTVVIVTLNVLAFVTLAYRSDYERRIVRELGFIAGSMRAHAFLTCMFLHADAFHLFANMAVLAAVGGAIERRSGAATFALVYLVSGLAGAAASAVLDPRTFVPMVGSSGAVAGVMGLCLLGAPRARVKIWFHAGVTAGAVRVRAAWLFSAWMVVQAVGAFYLSLGNATGVGYWAHIGGVAVGLAAGFVLRRAGRFEGHEQEREEAKKEEAKPESAEAAAGPAGVSRAPSRSAVRQRARERPAAPYLPGTLIALSILVSLIAVALRFTHGTLMGTLADFQGAWNSGDVERVARLFPDESREQFTRRLGAILSRLDPGASEGTVTYRIALLRARREGDRCVALFASAPPGTDPFRVERTGVIGVTFLRDADRWTVHALGMREMRPCDADGP